MTPGPTSKHQIPKLVKVRRKMTKTAIQQDPIELELVRTYMKEGRAGGFDVKVEGYYHPEQDENLEALPSQTFRMYSYGQLWRADETEEEGGQVRRLLWSLLGEYDADVQRGDRFHYDDRFFVVLFARPQSTLGYPVSKQIEIEQLK